LTIFGAAAGKLLMGGQIVDFLGRADAPKFVPFALFFKKPIC
jgi:hypothetical protein